jgi:putative flippase GtrA
VNGRQKIRRLFAHPLTKFGVKLGSFLAAGLPGFGLALLLNWLLVTRLHWNKSGAYALVLVVQVTLNFFMCRWFVFRDRKHTPLWTQLIQFVSGILFFRAADWALYTLLVSVFGFYFLAVQIANVVIFALLKFQFARKVMER